MVRERIAFLIPYIIVPLLVFGGVTAWKGFSVWVPRYWAWQELAWLVLCVLLVSRVFEARARSVELLLILVYLLSGVVSQVRFLEDWRGAADSIQSGEGCVALFSRLIEVETGASSSFPEFEEYVRAPLTVYGATRPIRMIGLTHSEERIGGALRECSTLVAARVKGPTGASSQKFISIAEQHGVRAELKMHTAALDVFQLQPAQIAQ